MAKAIKVGVKAGSGPIPGYFWSVYYLSVAREEAMGILNDGQYQHVADLFRALASEQEPTRTKIVTIEAVGSFFELKDKGGILGKINLRVFFTVIQDDKAILVLSAINKGAEGQTPGWVKTRVQYRLRKFHGGDYGRPV